MDKQTIEISKDLYNNLQYKQVINTSFSELKNSKEPLSLDKFFNDFDRIFLDIPIEGKQSLNSIFTRINEILNQGIDPKDQEIEDLLNQISSLQEELNKIKDVSEEESHPLFENGKLIKNSSTDEKYIMERGKKRQIFDGDTEKVLIQLNGGNVSTPFNEVCIQLSPSIINGIEDGVPINDSNFNLANSTIDPEIQRQIWNRDWSDPILDIDFARTTYGDIDEYLSSLARDLDAKDSVIEFIDEQIEKRLENIRVLRSEKNPNNEDRIKELRQEVDDLDGSLENTSLRRNEVQLAYTSLSTDRNLWLVAESGGVSTLDPYNNPLIKYSTLRANTKFMAENDVTRKNWNKLDKALQDIANRHRGGSTLRTAEEWIADTIEEIGGLSPLAVIGAITAVGAATILTGGAALAGSAAAVTAGASAAAGAAYTAGAAAAIAGAGGAGLTAALESIGVSNKKAEDIIFIIDGTVRKAQVTGFDGTEPLFTDIDI